MSNGKGKNEHISTDETMDLIRLQQVMNNPNVDNMFGNTSTTFDSNDQAHITQTLSPEMQALIGQQMDHVAAGPQQFEASRDPYAQGMMEQYNQRAADRAGFQPPPRSIPQGPPQMGPQGPMPPSGPMPQGPANPLGPNDQGPIPPSMGSGGGGGVDASQINMNPYQKPMDKSSQLMKELMGSI